MKRLGLLFNNHASSVPANLFLPHTIVHHLTCD